MIPNINPSPTWLAQLDLIDDWGPEISPANIAVGSFIVAARLMSGRAHLMRSDHLRDLPSADPPVAFVIIEHLLIDDSDLFVPKSLKA